MVVDSS